MKHIFASKNVDAINNNSKIFFTQELIKDIFQEFKDMGADVVVYDTRKERRVFPVDFDFNTMGGTHFSKKPIISRARISCL